MLLTQNDEYTDRTKETAFLEFVDDLNKVEHIPSPRILNTHVPYGWLPKQHIEKKRKIIHVVRNPKDVFVSYFHFKKNFGLIEDWNEFFKYVIVGPSKFYLIKLDYRISQSLVLIRTVNGWNTAKPLKSINIEYICIFIFFYGSNNYIFSNLPERENVISCLTHVFMYVQVNFTMASIFINTDLLLRHRLYYNNICRSCPASRTRLLHSSRYSKPRH